MVEAKIRRRRTALMVGATVVLLSGLFALGQGAQLGPLSSGVDRALKPARDLSNWISDSLRDRSENSQLKSRVSSLRWKVVRGQAAQAENRELHALVSLDRSGVIPPGIQPVTGEVIVRSLADPYSEVTVSVGRRDGVKVDDPIVNGSGLVGKVSAVRARTAQVELITAGQSAVSATVVGVGARGVVRPSPAGLGLLQLSYIDSEVLLHKGEKVATLGWQAGRVASHFPPGLLIGEVAGGSINEQEASGSRLIRAYANPSEIAFVQVLTGQTP